MRTFFLIILFCLAPTAIAHPGAVDATGGHFDRRANAYHCHKEPCFSNQRSVESATASAAREGLAVSKIYNREDWPHWVDLDNDCQNARAEVLIAASRPPVKFKRNNGCDVSQGEWLDPYSGAIFVRAAEIDIDHIVPLAHAHRNGGADWSREKKRTFANDPDNLIAVAGTVNKDKSDKAPDQWMPPLASYHCIYLTRWQKVKEKYGLKSSSAEANFVQKKMASCTIGN